MEDELTLIAGLRQAIELTDEPVALYEPEVARDIVSANGLSHENLGRILGVSTYTVGGWLRAEHVPGPQHAGRYQLLLSLLARRAEIRNGQVEARLRGLLATIREEAAA